MAENISIEQPKKRHWFLRSVRALLIPASLIFFATITLGMMGGKATTQIDSLVDIIWLPATVVRVIGYLLVAYWLVPKIIAKQANIVQYQIDHLKQNANDSDLLEKAYEQNKKYTFLLENRYIVLLGLMVFDAITLQLPYFLKG